MRGKDSVSIPELVPLSKTLRQSINLRYMYNRLRTIPIFIIRFGSSLHRSTLKVYTVILVHIR